MAPACDGFALISHNASSAVVHAVRFQATHAKHRGWLSIRPDGTSRGRLSPDLADAKRQGRLRERSTRYGEGQALCSGAMYSELERFPRYREAGADRFDFTVSKGLNPAASFPGPAALCLCRPPPCDGRDGNRV